SMKFSGSKPLTSAAIWQANLVESKWEMRATPLLPASTALQTSCVVLPTPQISPRPVTTTLRPKLIYPLSRVWRCSRPRPARCGSSRRLRREFRCRTLLQTQLPIPPFPANQPRGRRRTRHWLSLRLHPRPAAPRLSVLLFHQRLPCFSSLASIRRCFSVPDYVLLRATWRLSSASGCNQLHPQRN